MSKRVEATEMQLMSRFQLNSRVVPAFCVGSRAVGHDVHTSHVPRPHSADGSGDNTVKIKLREAPFLPRSVAEPMLCDGIYIEKSGVVKIPFILRFFWKYTD
ncbi:uncharacterized protein TNCV_2315351 [Trichonephila clavipes]|nr:uncharacterized protein TNCV_2315351 [Trichonephila clavipes]